MNTLAIKEQLIKKAVKSGNGGAVWVPKAWIGENVIVILPEKKLTIKEKIMKILESHLQDVVAVFLYGSYARNEQDSQSDIDVLVVADNKFTVKHGNYDIKVIELDKLQATIKKNPIMYFSIIHEAVPIINRPLLKTLQEIKINFRKFKWFLDTTKEHIKTSRKFIELDRLEGEYLTSHAVGYSVMLRLRGVFLINGLITGKKYSNLAFRQWVIKHVSLQEYTRVYALYRSIRDNKKISATVQILTVEKLLNTLDKETDKIVARIYGKKKEVKKRH